MNKGSKKIDEVELLKSQVEEWKAKYLRALADYQNFERRVGEERQALVEGSNTEFILKLLPFLDNLEKAEVFVKDAGLKLVKDQLWQTLADAGVEEVDVIGKEFDPHLAEAVEMIEGKQDNIVVDIVRKGYAYNNKVIRVAQVKVSKKKANEKEKEKAKEESQTGNYT